MKLIRVGPREYESTDKRFHALWSKRQGARSCWRVRDREANISLRAFSLVEVRETIRDMLNAQPPSAPPKAQPALITFIGECRSLTAVRKGWSWADGRLAAKPLFEALRAMGVDPAAHSFVNLFADPVDTHTRPASLRAEPKIDHGTVASLRECLRGGTRICVALGRRVSLELTRLGIAHVALVHPAARGRIRKRHRYINHVKTTLGPALGQRG